MKIDNQSHGNVCVIVPHGPLVLEEIPDVRRTLETASAARPGRVVLDCQDMPYVDSAGIELLLEFCGDERTAGARPKLARLSETCREALELTDVLMRIESFDTVENAVRSCKR